MRGRAVFHAEHVNVWAAMLRRHYPDPCRFICITDDPAGLAPDIEPVPLPVTGFEHLRNPAEQMTRRLPEWRQSGPRRPRVGRVFPACYRRLWNFSRAARAVLGERIFALDIDLLAVADLRPLVARTADFVGWSDPRFGWRKCAGGAYLLTTGTHPEVHETFDPATSPEATAAAGYGGSDQGWMSACLYPPAESFGVPDGVVKLNWLRPQKQLQVGPRLIFTNGERPPWHPATRATYPWIGEHWRL
jgi:hypothetical protein